MTPKHLSLLACSILISASAIANPHEDLRLYDIAESAKPERLKTDIETLVNFGTRHTLSDQQSSTEGIGAATRWIKAEFERISQLCGHCLEIIEVTDTAQGRRIPNTTPITNILAIKKGLKDPNRIVMMTGDIDSRVSDVMNAKSIAPGANDNASGVAGTIEAARILSQYDFDATIIFAAIAGEEQGLYGGKMIAQYAKTKNWHIEAVLNNDMIGNIAGINGVIDNHSVRIFSEGVRIAETKDEAKQRYYSGGENDSASRNLARFIKEQVDQFILNMDVQLVYRLDRFGRGGHHRPFNEAGIPAVRVMEVNEHYHRQHQNIRFKNGIHYGDTIEGVDFEFNAKLTEVNAVALAAMAWAPAPPSKVEISGQVSANTHLKWRKSKNANGYRVYWRKTTESEWTHSRWVGNVSQYTLKNMVIDNYLYGVASVSKAGHISPVVFPGAAGRF